MGWNLLDRDSLEIIDFMDALKDAGYRGDLTFCGKRSNHNDLDVLTINKPRENIAQEYWGKAQISWHKAYKWENNARLEFLEDNYHIQTYEIKKRFGDGYKDIQVLSDNIEKWIKKAKKEFSGRRQIQEDNRKKIWEQNDEKFGQ